jgi:hypothetical protein
MTPSKFNKYSVRWFDSAKMSYIHRRAKHILSNNADADTDLVPYIDEIVSRVRALDDADSMTSEELKAAIEYQTEHPVRDDRLAHLLESKQWKQKKHVPESLKGLCQDWPISRSNNNSMISEFVNVLAEKGGDYEKAKALILRRLGTAYEVREYMLKEKVGEHWKL